MSSNLDAQLKKLKIEKGIIASKFKHLQKHTPEYDSQLMAMQAISAQINSLESELKQSRQSATAKTTIASAPETELKILSQSTSQTAPFFNWQEGRDYDDEVFIQLTNHRDLAEWNRFVSDNPSSLPSHNPAWLDAIEKCFGHQSFIICARSSTGELLAGLPITILESTLFGRFGVSVPYLNYGGVVSRHPNLHQKLFSELDALREQFKLKHIEIRSIYAGLGEIVSAKKIGMILTLPKSDEILEKQLGSKLRAQYKKAEEFSPQVRIGHMELLDDFYNVLAQNMRDLGTPIYSKSWFTAILQHPNIQAHLVVVHLQSKPVAAGFLVQHRELMEIPWASTLKSANKYNMNMWMYRNILSFSIAQGCKYFDFGRSTMDAGTYKFKKQWGAEPHQHYWYSVLPQGAAAPALNPDNPKLKLLVSLWKWLPVWLSKIIGPIIIKGIP